MSTAVAELLPCPRSTPSDEQRAILARVEALARQLEPGLPKFETIWVDGRGSGSARLGEAITGARHRIVLRTDLDVAGLASTAAHEIGHVRDAALGSPLTEASADAFAARVLALHRQEDITMTGRTIATGRGRCARCQGLIAAGDEYEREEDATGAFVRGVHLVCPARNGHAGHAGGTRGPAPAPPARCLCGNFLLNFGRTSARKCGSCGRLFLA